MLHEAASRSAGTLVLIMLILWLIGAVKS